MRIIWKILKGVLLLGGIVFWGFVVVWLCRQRSSATISGHVEDALTGSKVPNAKIVVSAWDYGIWDANPRMFGTTTDQNGTFSLTVRPGRLIAWIDVSASTPDDKYAYSGKLTQDYAPLAAYPLAWHQREIESFHYKTFGGRWVGRVAWSNDAEPSSGANGGQARRRSL